MNMLRAIAIALIAAGVLALVYREFSYTKETHEAQIGPLALRVDERETLAVPVWAGVGAIVAGGLLLVFGTRKG